MKSAQDYLAEANAVVPKIETQAGIAKHGQSGTGGPFLLFLFANRPAWQFSPRFPE